MTIHTYTPDALPNLNVCNEIAEVIQDAFRERTESGIYFSCANITGLEYKEELGNSYVIIALDDNNKIAGTTKLLIKQKYNIKYGHWTLLAVSSKHKRKGVATLLFNELLNISQKENLAIITSNTAVTAYSSINMHLKNGFVKYSLSSSPRTNYYSVNFILPISRFNFVKNPIISNTLYFLSSLKCRLLKRKDGSNRFKYNTI